MSPRLFGSRPAPGTTHPVEAQRRASRAAVQDVPTPEAWPSRDACPSRRVDKASRQGERARRACKRGCRVLDFATPNRRHTASLTSTSLMSTSLTATPAGLREVLVHPVNLAGLVDARLGQTASLPRSVHLTDVPSGVRAPALSASRPGLPACGRAAWQRKRGLRRERSRPRQAAASARTLMPVTSGLAPWWPWGCPCPRCRR